MDLTELSRRLENLVRIGTVHSVDHGAVRCRVQSGDLVTQWLPWQTPHAGATRTWDPPTIGEQAIVLSPSGEAAGGLVFYGINSDAHPAPSNSPDEHVIAYPDGARITYNHASGHLSATGIQTAVIAASTSITLDTPRTHITGECVIDELLTYGNGIAGTGGSNGNMITGAFTQEGGPLSSNGVVLDEHTHTDVMPGGSNTGGPQ